MLQQREHQAAPAEGTLTRMYRNVVGPECDAAREAMSAYLDGEESPLSGAWLTAHVVECAGCRNWYAAAAQIRRRSRLALVAQVPDLVNQILATTAASTKAASTASAATRRLSVARVALAGAALTQLWFALPVLLFARDPDVSEHPAHELGSFGTALGVGFLVVAWRPRLARGMRPLVGAVAALLLATALVDLVHGGRTTVADEAPHLLAVTGFVLMWLMRSPPREGHGGSVLAVPTPPFTDLVSAVRGKDDAGGAEDGIGMVDARAAGGTDRASA